MLNRRSLILSGTAASLAAAETLAAPPPAEAAESFAVTHSDAEWRRMLSPAQYDVLRREGTERPYTSPLLGEKRAGIFVCAGCAQDVFASETKYDSGTGWPSFWAPLPKGVGTTRDGSLGMVRTAVHCSRCGGHLGHVFDDGPAPTGKRYCLNGIAMTFRAKAA